MKPNNVLYWFRMVAIAEGISFLILLLIAMPLKYYAGLPQAVQIFGWAHGVLFVAFLALSYEAKVVLNKKFSWLVIAFLASLLPLGTFVLEKKMRKDGNFLDN